MMHPILPIVLFTIILTSCDAQPDDRQTSSRPAGGQVGGPCEGCEAIHEYGSTALFPVDTLPSYADNEPKLVVTGTIFERDGLTPASNVILYIYHTDRRGRYPRTGERAGRSATASYVDGSEPVPTADIRSIRSDRQPIPTVRNPHISTPS